MIKYNFFFSSPPPPSEKRKVQILQATFSYNVFIAARLSKVVVHFFFNKNPVHIHRSHITFSSSHLRCNILLSFQHFTLHFEQNSLLSSVLSNFDYFLAYQNGCTPLYKSPQSSQGARDKHERFSLANTLEATYVSLQLVHSQFRGILS